MDNSIVSRNYPKKCFGFIRRNNGELRNQIVRILDNNPSIQSFGNFIMDCQNVLRLNEEVVQ